MNARFLLAMSAYVLPSFPIGYVWHLVIFAPQYERLALLRPDVIIPFGLASMLIQGALYAWIYPRLFDTTSTGWLRGALGFGCVFGLLAWSFMVLPAAAKYRMTSVVDFLMLETGFTILQYLIVSPLIAYAWRHAGALPPATSERA